VAGLETKMMNLTVRVEELERGLVKIARMLIDLKESMIALEDEVLEVKAAKVCAERGV